MPGVRTMAKCATGTAKLDTMSRTVIALGIVATAHAADTMGLTVSGPMTTATRTKTARSIPLTLTLSAVTVLLLITTLTSKGH